jgi:hypothetical protein
MIRVGAADRRQPLQRAVVGDAPLDDRVVLRVSRGDAARRVAVLAAGHETPEELDPQSPAGLGGREEDMQQALGCRLVHARCLGDVPAPAVHSRRALWTGSGEDEAPHQRRTDQRHILRREAADREPEQVDLGEAERLGEGDHPPGGVGDRGAELAARRTDAGIVDDDHLALGGQRIAQRRIPVVEVAAEVLKHHQRRRARSAEAPERQTHVARVDELRRRGEMRHGRHIGAAHESPPWLALQRSRVAPRFAPVQSLVTPGCAPGVPRARPASLDATLSPTGTHGGSACAPTSSPAPALAVAGLHRRP